jgi:hypothetical protein
VEEMERERGQSAVSRVDPAGDERRGARVKVMETVEAFEAYCHTREEGVDQDGVAMLMSDVLEAVEASSRKEQPGAASNMTWSNDCRLTGRRGS